MAAVELMESGDPDEEMIGIIAVQRMMAEDVEEEYADAVLMAAAVAGQDSREPVPYLPYVCAAFSRPGLVGCWEHLRAPLHAPHDGC